MRQVTTADMHKHTQEQIQTRTTRIHTNTQTYTHTHTSCDARTHAHTCIHMYTYIHTHTRTHMRKNPFYTHTRRVSLSSELMRPRVITDDQLSATPNVNCQLDMQISPIFFANKLYDLLQKSPMIVDEETAQNPRRQAVCNTKRQLLSSFVIEPHYILPRACANKPYYLLQKIPMIAEETTYNHRRPAVWHFKYECLLVLCRRAYLPELSCLFCKLCMCACVCACVCVFAFVFVFVFCFCVC